MEKVKRQYIIERKGTRKLYFSIRVPDYCKRFFGNKSFIRKSTGETDRNKAQLKASKWAIKYEEQFQSYKETKEHLPSKDAFEKMIAKHFEYAAAEDANFILNASEAEVISRYSGTISALEDMSLRLSEGDKWNKSKKHEFYQSFITFLKENSVYYDDNSNLDYPYVVYRDAYMKYLEVFLEMCEEKRDGKSRSLVSLSKKYYALKNEGLSNQDYTSKIKDSEVRYDLFRVLDMYQRDFNSKRGLDSQKRYKSASRLLKDYFSDNPDFNSISRSQLRQLARKTHLLPNLQIHRDFKNINFINFLNGKYSKPYYKISSRSAEYFIQAISTIFKKVYLEYSDIIDFAGSNPALGLSEHVNTENKPAKLNTSYTVQELNQIFKSREFIDYAKNPKDKSGGLFWGVMIALFNGARRSEIAQLYTRDFEYVNGIYCLSIDDGNYKNTEKSVKNQNSRRQIPLSQHIINMGFIDYVEYIKSIHGEYADLFPEFIKKHNIRTNVGKELYVQFNKLVKRIGVYREGLTLHGLRHSFRSMLQNAGELDSDRFVPVDIIDSLGGWSPKKLSKNASENYGDGYSAKLLRKYLDYANVYGLEYEHLKVNFGGNRSAVNTKNTRVETKPFFR